MSEKSFADWFVLGLPWFMGALFLVGATVRLLIFYTVKRHEWFIREFEKRVSSLLDSEVPGVPEKTSFYGITKRLLEKTYYEAFELRDRNQRRNSDKILSLSDRLFMVRQGCAWIVRDLLKQIRLVKWSNEPPRLLTVTKATFHQNPYFNRVIGLFPVSGTNDLVSILPGMFVVGGILGTFIGISKGLPELAGMDIQNVENSKLIMDRFLHEVAFAMHSSILGITGSILMNLVNTSFSPERLYVSMNDRFENTLEILWHKSDNNSVADTISKDIQRDAAELLAEETLNLEIAKNPRGRDLDLPKKTKIS